MSSDWKKSVLFQSINAKLEWLKKELLSVWFERSQEWKQKSEIKNTFQIDEHLNTVTTCAWRQDLSCIQYSKYFVKCLQLLFDHQHLLFVCTHCLFLFFLCLNDRSQNHCSAPKVTWSLRACEIISMISTLMLLLTSFQVLSPQLGNGKLKAFFSQSAT